MLSLLLIGQAIKGAHFTKLKITVTFFLMNWNKCFLKKIVCTYIGREKEYSKKS